MTQRFNVLEHLDYLRLRLIRSLIAFVSASAVAYFALTGLVMEHLIGADRGLSGLVFLSPAEAFFARVKLSFALGFVIAFPAIMYQVWALFSPGMNKTQRRVTLWAVPVAYLLFVAGCLFAFLLVLPLALDFFLGFGGDGLQQEISVGNYVSFLIGFVLPFGIVFELPVAVLVLARVGIIQAHVLAGKRKYAIFAIFVLAAALTPPDVFSQLMLALPLLVLYEASVILARIIGRKEADGESDGQGKAR